MYFHRAMSDRGIDSNPVATNAAATASVTASVPCGHRPTSSIAIAFGAYACTTPGSACHVGAITVTPWTLANRRRAATSLATPFCRHTIGVDGGRHGGDGVEHTVGVLALGGDDHHVAVGERELRSVADDGHPERDLILGPLHGQPAVGDRLAVLAARDEDDIVTVLEHPPADDPTDRTRAVDDEPPRIGRRVAHAVGARSRSDRLWATSRATVISRAANGDSVRSRRHTRQI